MAGLTVHNKLMVKAKLLFERRDLTRLEKLLAQLPRTMLFSELELCLMLAITWSYQRRDHEAKALLSEAKGFFFASDDDFLIARWRLNYANQILMDGELAEAESLYRMSLETAERLGNPRLIGNCQNGLGIVAAYRGEFELGIAAFSRSLLAAQQSGSLASVGAAHFNLGNINREWGRFLEAAARYSFASDYYSAAGTYAEKVYTSAEQSLLHAELGDFVLAERIARRALEQVRKIPNVRLQANTSKVLGRILTMRGELQEAAKHLADALDLAQTTNSVYLKAEVHEEMAVLSLREGYHGTAMHHAETAKGFYRLLGAMKHCVRLDSRLAGITAPSS